MSTQNDVTSKDTAVAVDKSIGTRVRRIHITYISIIAVILLLSFFQIGHMQTQFIKENPYSKEAAKKTVEIYQKQQERLAAEYGLAQVKDAHFKALRIPNGTGDCRFITLVQYLYYYCDPRYLGTL